MKIWFDTEFQQQDPETPVLLSIGAVREDGLTYYAEQIGIDYERCEPWVRANVVPLFRGPKLSLDDIKQGFWQFCGPTPQFWAYYGTYDFWLLMQLYGGWSKWPNTWPQFFNELRSYMNDRKRHNLPPMRGAEHNALDDALWTKLAWEYVMLANKDD